MSGYSKALIALTVVTFATYGLLVGLGVAHLFPEEGGKPFDLHIVGYTFKTAQSYLAHLSPEAAAFYTGPMRWLDTAFPLLMGLWMGWCLWGLTRDFHPWSRVILLVVPASFTVMDLCENALVSDMVAAGPTLLDRDLVALASSYTICKFVTLCVAFGLLLVMMFRNAGESGWVRGI